LKLIRVAGPSMVPTLRSGDVVLVSCSADVRPGDIVVARYRSMPGVLVVKRAACRRAGGWELASDNPSAGGDSSVHGVADVMGRAVLRWRRRGRVGISRL
jgi:phage repressor protein C with HTH and peptisase S24 domain